MGRDARGREGRAEDFRAADRVRWENLPMRPRSLRTPAAALGLLACTLAGGGACIDDQPPLTPRAGPTARFRLATDGSPPAVLDVPFPSDVYLRDGRWMNPLPSLPRVVKAGASYASASISKTNGFSRIAESIFYLDDPSAPRTDDDEAGTVDLDPATLPATEADCAGDKSSVYLVDLDEADPAKARVGCRAAFHDDRVTSQTRPMLGVGPGRGLVLPEGRRYAAVLTSRLKDKRGRALGKTPDFDAAIAGDAPGVGRVYADAHAKVKAALAGALAGDRAEIIALAPYTTQKMTEVSFGLREEIEKATYALSWDAKDVAPMSPARFAPKAGGVLPAGFTASLDDWLGVATQKLPDGTDDPDTDLPVRAHDKIAAVGTAVFTAKSWLQKKASYDDFEHMTFAIDAAGKPAPQPDVKIWVTIALPQGPMPPTGFPCVVIQHGLGGSREYLLTMANTFAKKGWAAVAIDSVTFGARAADPSYQVDATTDYGKAPGVAYTGPDGISDTVAGGRNGPFDFFGGLKNIGSLRDQLRQAELDTAQVVKLLRSNPDLSPLKTGADAPKIDPDRIAYVGDSLGGIEGAAAAALEPHVRAWTLNVAGGGIFTEIGGYGPAINAQLSAAGGLNFGFRGDRFDESHVLVSIFQTAIESGDPIAYAGRVVTDPHPLAGAATAPRNVFQVEVLYDELVSNEANEALARAGGWGLLAPNVGANAGVFDAKSTSSRRQPAPLAEIGPAPATGLVDTPKAGVTTVLVQVSPATHGADLVSSRGTRSYGVPFGSKTGGGGPFTRFDSTQQYKVRNPYRELQGSMVGFFESAFAGQAKLVPPVAPRRDTDDDGKLDAEDDNPSRP